MVRMKVSQVTFTEAGAVVAGELVDDPTKVMVAGVLDPLAALPVAMAVASGMQPEVDPPDDAVIGVVEKPKDAL